MNDSDAAAIIQVAKEAAVPANVIPGELYVLGDGSLLDTTKYSDRPSRKTGQMIVHDAASFTDYVSRHHAAEATEVWADAEHQTIVAVLNAPSADYPGWSDHRVVLTLRPTPQWQAWTRRSGQFGSQNDFAEHIEDNLPDIVSPESTIMLELAQTFQATNKVQFESSHFLDSGQRGLTYREDVDAKAGKKGQITIPATFELGLAPFLGTSPYRVLARLRYRISDGHLTIGYKLDRPDAVLDAAFSDIQNEVAANLPGEMPVLNGIPAR